MNQWVYILIGFVLMSNLMMGQDLPFKDITDSAGIDHQFLVFEGLFGGGACVFDLDKDGFEDVYMTSGLADDVLYRNNGDGTFKNIIQNSGLDITSQFVTQGVAGADVNRDGWVDLFITTISTRDTSVIIPREKNLLFLNNGDGTFRDVTEEYGLDQFYSFSLGGNFGDFNADGYPDLFVGNYFQEYDGPLSTITDATIVGQNQISEDYLFLNVKGRRFKDVYQDYGLSHRGFGFGGVFTDYDNDGDQDLFVNNDFGYKRTPDLLLENQYPSKHFVDKAEDMGMDLKINSMGTAVGDFNSDGFMDYYMTNIKFNWLMVNQGPGKPFVNKAEELGMSYFSISWGANFADFDHDGDVDLFVNNGDLNPNCTPMGNFYFRNEDGKFVESGREMGVNGYGVGRGSVVFDIENDGDLDILAVCQKPILEYPTESVTKLYRNDLASGNWLKIDLRGVAAESHGLGSKVKVVAGDLNMIREIDGGGSSHISQNSVIAHFGLADYEIVDSVIVYWTGGHKQVLTEVTANQLLTVVEEERPSSIWSYVIMLLVAGVIFLTALIFRRQNISGDVPA